MNKSIAFTATIVTKLIVLTIFLPNQLFASASASDKESGNSSMTFLVLFVIALILLIGAVIFFMSKLKAANDEKETVKKDLDRKYQKQVAQAQIKVQTYHKQGQEVFKRLQTSIDKNKELKVKFQGAYDELAKRLKAAENQIAETPVGGGADSAELDKVQNQLKEAQAMILHAEKMSSLGQLTAGIAHEINNPVNFVSNGVSSLKENYTQLLVFIDNYRSICELESIEEVKKYYKILREDDKEFNAIKSTTEESLDDVEYGTTRITEIVNGLRTFSRQDEAELKDSNINEIIDNALLILKPKYKKKAKVLKDLSNEVSIIKCIPGQINQVLVNLIGNAADAIDFKGTITIRTVNVDSEKFDILIQDDGKGMSEDVLHKIFDPFYTTKPVGKGTGLGLSITYGIIEKHGGSIKVDSVIGKGTTFTITLPKKAKIQKIKNNFVA